MSDRSSTRLSRSALLIGALALVMGATQGCTRTSDGTIVVAAPKVPSWTAPRLPSFRRAPEPQLAPSPEYVYPRRPDAEAAPPRARQTAVRRAPPRSTAPRATAPRAAAPRATGSRIIGVRAPFERPKDGKPLSCANQVVEGGRVKVVCQ